MATFGPVNPDRDTLIESVNTTYNYGQRNTLWLDWFNPGGARAMLAWDVSSIPVGNIVSSATLSFVIQSNGLSGATGYHACAMRTADSGDSVFVEGSGTGSATGDGATWESFDGTYSWTTAGAEDDFVSPGSAFTVTTGETTKSIDVKIAIQDALDSYRDSSGLIALLLKRDNESGSSQTLRFWSNQAVNPANRPLLTIVHSAPVSRRGVSMPIIRRRRSNFAR